MGPNADIFLTFFFRLPAPAIPVYLLEGKGRSVFSVCSHYPWFEKTEGDCLGEVNFLWKLKSLTSYFLFLHTKLSHSATEQYNHVRQINHAISSEYPKTVTKAITQWMQFMQLREEAWKNRSLRRKKIDHFLDDHFFIFISFPQFIYD